MFTLWRDTGDRVRVLRLTQTDEIERLIGLFEQIAAGEGWQPGGGLRRYPERSVYFALEVEGRFIGGLQLVLPDSAGRLPYQAIWPEVRPEIPDQAHVAVLALEASFRGQPLLFWRLVVELWRHCVGAGVPTLSLEVTPRVLPLYQRLGWPLQVVGEPRLHWGEACYLATLGVPEVAAALLQRAEHSAYYRQIVTQAFRVTLASSSGPTATIRARKPLRLWTSREGFNHLAP